MRVDVVVVAYRSAGQLRTCVEPLCGHDDIAVTVVDNACPEDSTSRVADLPVRMLPMGANRGFAAACNAGAARGDGDAILFLNPDARIDPADVRSLAATFARHPRCGACGPAIRDDAGGMHLSVRRDPRVRTAFAEALCLHRLLPRAGWTTEIVREGYDRERPVEWLSGAAICVRRAVFEEVGGFDERYFLYSEDADLCARIRARRLEVRFVPTAAARHEGGASTPSGSRSPLLAEARIRYARAHARLPRYLAFRAAFTLHELVRVARRRGRAAALGVTLGRKVERPPSRAVA